MTPGLSWFRPRRPYVQQKGRPCITCTGVLVVGGTSLSERGRGAPKSLDVLGVIEASASIGWSERVFLSSLFRVAHAGPPPHFTDQGGGSYMCRRSTGSSFSPNPGKNSWQLLS